LACRGRCRSALAGSCLLWDWVGSTRSRCPIHQHQVLLLLLPVLLGFQWG